MSVRRHLCRPVRNVRFLVEYVWISDGFFDAAIHRFGRYAVSKRDVSFAPGPLEARKRETKRRLAHINLGNDGTLGDLDPILFPDVNENARKGEWHWQAPRIVQLPETSPPLSWLSDLVHPPATPKVLADEQDENAAEAQIREKPVKVDGQLQEARFLSKLGCCRDHDVLRHLGSPSKNIIIKHSQRAFRRLYKSQKSLETCLSFLEDTSLDDPSARNLPYLLGELSQQLKGKWDTDHTQVRLMRHSVMVPWLKAQLALGKRSNDDIWELGKFMSELARYDLQKFLCHDFMIAVLEGLRSSALQSFKDITPATRNLLLKLVMKGRLTNSLQDLGLSLAETVTKSALVSQFLLRSIRSRAVSHDLFEASTSEQDIFPRIKTLLKARSQATAGCIVHTTSKLLIKWQASVPQYRVNGKPCAELVDRWWSLIAGSILPEFRERGLGNFRVEQTIPSDRLDMIAIYAMHLGGNKKARFVFSNWFHSRLPSHDYERLFNALRQNLNREGNDPSFLCILRTLHEDQRLEEDFIRHLLHLLDRMCMYGLMAKILKRMRDFDIHIPLDVVLETIDRLLTISPQQAHRSFRSDPRIPLEKFPILAEFIIKVPSLHPNLVWHYQRKRSWQSTMEDPDLCTELKDEPRTRLLGTMALAFSRAPHLSSRMARRQVMKCVRCWKNERLGLLSPQITRALTRAGIIRPLHEKGGADTTLITYILGLVRQVEGSAQADKIDHILHAWLHRLKSRDKPRLNLERRIESEQGPSKKYFFWRRWSNTHRQYDLLMFPDRRKIPRHHYLSLLYTSKYYQRLRRVKLLPNPLDETRRESAMPPANPKAQAHRP